MDPGFRRDDGFWVRKGWSRRALRAQEATAIGIDRPIAAPRPEAVTTRLRPPFLAA